VAALTTGNYTIRNEPLTVSWLISLNVPLRGRDVLVSQDPLNALGANLADRSRGFCQVSPQSIGQFLV